MKKRILIISSEAWRDEISGGNVLSNLFSGFLNDYEFAQIYTNSQLPFNLVCKNYFHISEKEMFRSLLKLKPFGKKLYYENFPKNDLHCQNSVDISNNGFFSFARKLRWEIMQTVRYSLWKISRWKTPELENFILDFKPDIIFAPMYYDLHIHRLDRYVSKLTKKKLISYAYDDHLSLKQFSISPIYWLNRVLLHYNVKHTAKYYGLLYSMTQEQINEYFPVLKVPMKILKKGGDFNRVEPKIENFNKPLKIIYGGNLFYHRDKVLCKIIKSLKEINKKDIKIQLFIYTQAKLNKDLYNKLHDGRNSFLMGRVSNEELMEIYKKSDIALHVESFELKQRLITRLSFSTKIIDLLNAAKCIVAICWDKSSPYKYLKAEDAAICISEPNSILVELQNLVDNPLIITKYASKSWMCGKRNHNIQDITAMLKKDFTAFIENSFDNKIVS